MIARTKLVAAAIVVLVAWASFMSYTAVAERSRADRIETRLARLERSALPAATALDRRVSTLETCLSGALRDLRKLTVAGQLLVEEEAGKACAPIAK